MLLIDFLASKEGGAPVGGHRLRLARAAHVMDAAAGPVQKLYLTNRPELPRASTTTGAKLYRRCLRAPQIRDDWYSRLHIPVVPAAEEMHVHVQKNFCPSSRSECSSRCRSSTILPYEYYRLAPPGVMLVMVAVGLAEVQQEDVERVFAPIDVLVDQLVEREVDLIMQSGSAAAAPARGRGSRPAHRPHCQAQRQARNLVGARGGRRRQASRPAPHSGRQQVVGADDRHARRIFCARGNRNRRFCLRGAVAGAIPENPRSTTT